MPAYLPFVRIYIFISLERVYLVHVRAQHMFLRDGMFYTRNNYCEFFFAYSLCVPFSVYRTLNLLKPCGKSIWITRLRLPREKVAEFPLSAITRDCSCYRETNRRREITLLAILLARLPVVGSFLRWDSTRRTCRTQVRLIR